MAILSTYISYLQHVIYQNNTPTEFFFSFSSLCSHQRRLAYLIQISVHAEYSLKNCPQLILFPEGKQVFFFILILGNTFMRVNPYVCWLSLSFFLYFFLLFSCLLFKIRNGQKVGLKSYSAEGLVCKIDVCFIMNSYPQFW